MFFINYDLKKIKVSADFETNALLPQTLLLELSSIKRKYPERFGLLIDPKGNTRVFNSIGQLEQDAQLFALLSPYKDELLLEKYLEQQIKTNMANIWKDPQELITQLKIRKTALSLMDNNNSLRREIITKLSDSNRKFKSVEHFNLEVNFRVNAVTLMNNDKFHQLTGGYQYPTSEANYLRLKSEFWDQPDQLGLFKLKAGVLPADAINSIFDDSSLVVLECHSMMMCIQYKALLDTIGADHFNSLFKSKSLVIADGAQLQAQYKEELYEILEYTPGLKKETLIPGDWLYLYNFPEYSVATLFDPSKDGNGLHSMAMGDGRYRGFGSPLMTEEEAKLHFLEIYNEDFCAFPIKLVPESIDYETMGLDCDEEGLNVGDRVIINGHINCPVQEWQHVECLYQGNGRFNCAKLNMENATEEAIVLALLDKYNSFLPEKKTVDDLKNLNVLKSISSDVRSINFSSERFSFLFPSRAGLNFFDKKNPAFTRDTPSSKIHYGSESSMDSNI